MIDVFIVEDEAGFCELLTHALLETKEVRIVGTAGSGEATALDKVGGGLICGDEGRRE